MDGALAAHYVESAYCYGSVSHERIVTFRIFSNQYWA